MKKASGKTPTSETPRVPSTVPNDYNHLGVPGSLDMPLGAARRRRRSQARRRGMPNWVKALIAIGTAAVAFGIVVLVIFIIAFPPFFRGLEPRYQQRLIDMFPPFDALRPTVPFEVLPTLGGGSDSEAAQQLLLTPVGTPVAPVETLDSGTPSPTAPPTPTEAGIPIGMGPTLTPTLLPVYQSPTPPQQAPLQPTWTPVVVPTQVPLPKTYRLYNIRYEQQGWNNCGPTTMTMALSYFAWPYDQYRAAQWMKPHPEDKNVSPWQMVRFVNDNVDGVKALYRIGGNAALLKRLLAADFPVVVEESIQPAGEDWMGHYVFMIGYDEYQQHFLTYDSFLGYNHGEGRPSPYSQFDERWRHFNRVFIVLYEPSREIALRAALGEFVDPAYGYKVALEIARDEASRHRDDAWAWFNMGTAYVSLGEYANAVIAYDEAQHLGLPWRMLWYQFGPYEAYFQMGQYGNVKALANNTIATTKYVEESYYWRGMAFAAEGNGQAAIEDFNRALTYNRNFFPAQDAKGAVESGTFAVAKMGP